MDEEQRRNAEWLVLNALRELIMLAAKGDSSKGTYDNALELGRELYPELLGPNTSLLRRERESDTVKEYRQLAHVRSLEQRQPVDPLALVQADIAERRDLLQLAKTKKDRAKVDQIKRRVDLLVEAERTLNPTAHTENQLIFRDVHAVKRNVDPRAHLRRNLRFRPPENSWRLYEPDFDFLDEFFGRFLTPNSLLSEP